MRKRNVEVAGKIGQSDQLQRNPSGSATNDATLRVQFGRRSDCLPDGVDTAKQARARAYQEAIKAQMEEKQRRVEQEKARIKAEDLALERKILEASKVKNNDVDSVKDGHPAFLEAPASEVSQLPDETGIEEQQLPIIPPFLQGNSFAPQQNSHTLENRSNAPEVTPSWQPTLGSTSPASWLQDSVPVPSVQAPYQDTPAVPSDPSYSSYSYYTPAQYQPPVPPTSTMFEGQSQPPHAQRDVFPHAHSGLQMHPHREEDDGDVELDCETALVML